LPRGWFWGNAIPPCITVLRKIASPLLTCSANPHSAHLPFGPVAAAGLCIAKSQDSANAARLQNEVRAAGEPQSLVSLPGHWEGGDFNVIRRNRRRLEGKQGKIY